jgi:hypothetical protein
MNDLRQDIENLSIPEPNSGCWLWLGMVYTTGYGGVVHQGITKLAHRASYEAFHGVIPRKMLICHHCDNPSCVNPDHLFLGTEQDNADDMVKKKRWRQAAVRSMATYHSSSGWTKVRI